MHIIYICAYNSAEINKCIKALLTYLCARARRVQHVRQTDMQTITTDDPQNKTCGPAKIIIWILCTCFSCGNSTVIAFV